MKKILALTIGILFAAIMLVATSSSAGAAGENGTTLTATVDVTPHWTITYGWTIDKSVDPSTLNTDLGPETATYRIEVTKDAGMEAAWVDGQVCVTNGGAVATENLAITAVLQNGYGPPNDFLTSAPVVVSGNPVLDPGETGCFNYHVNIPITGGAFPQPHAGGTYKVTANVTITNHSGSLGTPKGPSPSATCVFPSEATLINDTINVDDTNGGSWQFNDDGYVEYKMVFDCEDSGENTNTATIRETGDSDNAVVVVTCTPVQPQGTLGITKFYDANANGVKDGGETDLDDWGVTITPDGGLPETVCTPASVELADGSYTIAEGTPFQTNWVATTPKSVDREIPGGADVSFGNVCLGGGGGLTLGFWSNKNGQIAFGTVGGINVVQALNLRNASGTHFNPTTYTQFRTWLLNAKATNMANMLSAQLAAMALNVEAGFVDPLDLVYAGGCGNTGAGNEFISIEDLMDTADSSLGLYGLTLSGDPNRAEQECLKNALDRANNNLNFVQAEPCEYTFVCPAE